MTPRYNDGYDAPEARDGALSNLILIVFAVIFPPLAVFFTHGFRGQFWLNILLTIFFYVPGLCHAIWLIARR